MNLDAYGSCWQDLEDFNEDDVNEDDVNEDNVNEDDVRSKDHIVIIDISDK